MQVTIPAASLWVAIFIVIMKMGVSTAIMQVVLSAVDYAHDFSIVIMQMTLSFTAMLVAVSSNNFIFLSLTENLFIKLTKKHLKALYQVCISPNQDTLRVEIIYKLVT